MDIRILLEDIIPTRKSVSLNRSLANPNADYGINKNVIGKGHYSKVSPDKDQHMVKKHTHNFEEIDPYHAYIDAIVDSHMTNNPWFPRVYNIKEYKDLNGNIGRKYTMEKLITYNDIDEELMIAFVRNLLSKDKFDYIMESASDPNELKFYNYDKVRAIHSLYTKYLAHLIISPRRSGEGTINDTNLLAALDFIKTLIKESEYKYEADLHANNLMYRRTQHGIQGVLADPIA